MATRAEVRTSLRLRLEDSGGSPVWDDAMLNEAIAAALRSYGGVFPKQITTGVTVPAGAARVVTGTTIDAARITRVTDAAGIWVAPWPPWEAQAAGAGRGQAWRWWGGDLLLAEPAAGSAAGIWTIEHLAGRTPPAADGETVDVVAGDEEIVLALAAAVALARRATEDAKRGVPSEAGARAGAARDEAERLIRARRRRVRGG